MVEVVNTWLPGSKVMSVPLEVYCEVTNEDTSDGELEAMSRRLDCVNEKLARLITYIVERENLTADELRTIVEGEYSSTKIVFRS
jgi:uncharacterized protein involved in propanediol utilization